MATRVDIETYRNLYLRPVENRLFEHKDEVPHFTSALLEDAIRTELNRADPDTWEIEVPDNKEQAMKEAEKRILDFMKKNFDLGVGKGSVMNDPGRMRSSGPGKSGSAKREASH
ncbi:MAG: hypothetical protein Kow0025_18850 [Thermodesulfovibrionales bacterium]